NGAGRGARRAVSPEHFEGVKRFADRAAVLHRSQRASRGRLSVSRVEQGGKEHFFDAGALAGQAFEVGVGEKQVEHRAIVADAEGKRIRADQRRLRVAVAALEVKIRRVAEARALVGGLLARGE